MIELLYFEGCPHHAATRALVRDVLADLGVQADVREIEVRDNDAATRLRFPGSPTIRVNGADIEADAGASETYALACRTYATPEGRTGVPPRPLLAQALEALKSGGGPTG